MGATTWTYGGASLTAALVAALVALWERLAVPAPIWAPTGTSARFAGRASATSHRAQAAAAMTHDAVARKADDRVPPRGRRL